MNQIALLGCTGFMAAAVSKTVTLLGRAAILSVVLNSFIHSFIAQAQTLLLTPALCYSD